MHKGCHCFGLRSQTPSTFRFLSALPLGFGFFPKTPSLGVLFLFFLFFVIFFFSSGGNWILTNVAGGSCARHSFGGRRFEECLCVFVMVTLSTRQRVTPAPGGGGAPRTLTGHEDETGGRRKRGRAERRTGGRMRGGHRGRSAESEGKRPRRGFNAGATRECLSVIGKIPKSS